MNIHSVTPEEQHILKRKVSTLILQLLARWGNLTKAQILQLLNVSPDYFNKIWLTLKPFEYGQQINEVDLISFVFFPGGNQRLYSCTPHAMRLLGFVKNKKDTNGKPGGLQKPRIVKVPMYRTKFNIYETEHTTLCIRKLIELAGEKQTLVYYRKDSSGGTVKVTKDVIKLDHTKYLTARELGSKWIPMFKKIKHIWHKAVEERKPDLIILKDMNNRMAVEIELTPKSMVRMKIVLKSLFALGDYTKLFDKLIVYANNRERYIYNRWDRLVKKSVGGEKPRNTEVRTLFDDNVNLPDLDKKKAE